MNPVIIILLCLICFILGLWLGIMQSRIERFMNGLTLHSSHLVDIATRMAAMEYVLNIDYKKEKPKPNAKA